MSAPPQGEDGRETFAGRRSTLLTMIGVAVGLGNVWRFPYMVGAYGGGAFVAVFLAIVLLFGVPCLMAEWTLGRHTRRGPLEAFALAGMPFGRELGFLLSAALVAAFSYYSVIVGRVGWYALSSVGLLPRAIGPWAGLATTAILLLLVGLVLALGVRRGIERASAAAMPLLAVLLVVLLARTLTLPGAWEEAANLLRPRVSDMEPATFLAALGQAFFSLSLGGTFFLIYGSYLPRRYDIPRNAAATALADTGVALAAGFIVLPAAAAFGIPADEGPSLLFVTLPQVFDRMPAGALFGALFFVGLFLAAFLSSMAAMEVLAGGAVDRLGWSRARSLWAVGAGGFLLAIPAALWDDYIGKADLVFGSTMQPVGSLVSVVALAWFVGRARALDEVNRGSRHRAGGFWIFWLRYVVPGLILAILLYGWLG